uniref:Unkown protein n=1 Tax=Riptortus pedestris TaxID=329032 RepID=R4WE36_RIPPE|nr:unkown protein [Riptortus pedestris]
MNLKYFTVLSKCFCNIYIICPRNEYSARFHEYIFVVFLVIGHCVNKTFEQT